MWFVPHGKINMSHGGRRYRRVMTPYVSVAVATRRKK